MIMRKLILSFSLFNVMHLSFLLFLQCTCRPLFSLGSPLSLSLSLSLSLLTCTVPSFRYIHLWRWKLLVIIMVIVFCNRSASIWLLRVLVNWIWTLESWLLIEFSILWFHSWEMFSWSFLNVIRNVHRIKLVSMAIWWSVYI